MEKRIKKELLEDYRRHLFMEEKSPNTIEKYMRDLEKLMKYANGREISKEVMIAYKEQLIEKQYKARSINSFIVAANRFFEYMEWYGIGVKTLKIQNEVFCSEERELTKAEYKRLVEAAKKEGKIRLAMILQTICSMGLRISELPYVTVASVRKGVMEVHNKGKIRTVLMPEPLKKQLLIYISKKKIKRGIIFCTNSGKAVNRNNIWRDMKKLCERAKVKKSKVFPHNLRHLFARSYYAVKKDIAKLANLLGHSSIETTRMFYLRSSTKEYRKQLNTMDLVIET